MLDLVPYNTLGVVSGKAFLLLSRHSDSYRSHLTGDGEIGRLGSEVIIDQSPRSHGPAVVQLRCSNIAEKHRRRSVQYDEERANDSEVFTCQTRTPAEYSFPWPFQFLLQTR